VTAFNDLVATFLDELFELQPDYATWVGDHRHDGRWPDMSEAGHEARLAFLDRWQARVVASGPAGLSEDDRIDRELLLGELDAFRFAEAEVREETWAPMLWVYLIGGGLHPLLSRDFAPLAVRLASACSRLEGVPALLDQAREVVGSNPQRPVSRLHAETAGRRIGGVASLARDAVAQAEAAADGDADVAALLPRLREAADRAASELEAMGDHLRTEVVAATTGGAELGEPLFTSKLRHTLRDPEITAQDVLDRADREYAAVRAEMVRIARSIWADWHPGEPMPENEGALVRGTLDAITRDHPRAEELVDFCREELGRIEAFCREREVIGLVDEPLEIDWTPEFLRAFAGAMLDSPGPLDVGQKTFFSITPVREDWNEDERESYLREMNARQLRLLTIHEAVPGHYLQMAYANRGSSLARRVFRSGLFAEGWAVYITQVMLDLGYGGDDPALWLVHWKFYLRAAVNAIIDVRIHTMGMTSEEAIDLMVDGAFQERSEAVAKDERARLSSTQLVTYFLGSAGMWKLEDEARRRAAVAAGGSRDDVPAPRVVGGYGPTPGFDYRAHLESVISHGAPPIPILREILLG
jgi:Arc/MetJ-type ribon-helix-helix transcriptional regulator